jgi:hypothetical protein
LITINNESGCWPTQSQELLLRAALLQGPEAIRAWEEWASSVNVEVVDFGSHRLLPQVYANLLRHGVRHPLMATFKGIYRYYWYQNQILFRDVSPLLRSLQDAGLKPLLLKGSALIPLYYKEFGLRPMQDFDVMVPPSQLAETITVLEELGWQFVHPSARDWIPFRHSTPLRNQNGRFLDLHWHLFGECWHFRDDDDLWEKAIPIRIGPVAALALDPTDQLLHVCAHGARWNEVPPVRWIVDAMMILNSVKSAIDWDRVLDRAEKHRLTLPMLDCLHYLQNRFGAPVPLSVLHKFENVPTSRTERDLYKASTEPLEPRTTIEITRLLFGDYAWLTSGANGWQKPTIFAKYLQQRWGVKHLLGLPFYLSYRILRHLSLSAMRYFEEPNQAILEMRNAWSKGATTRIDSQYPTERSDLRP